RYQVEPANLKLEITETMLMEDKNISLLHSLRELGVRLVMDDFGTGYSSFAYLQKFLFDVLKIDKSFVLRLGTDDTVQPLVQAMIQMAHSLRMQVVAEGIETDEVATFLTNESCEMGQGYLYDPALPMDEFTARYLRPFRTSTV
ncbi:MAG: EAL domain-containing protein, partial [Leptospiraceae bacterium]|nr:EAL domain-containing protein [Leptospiraceae bacterium]